MDWLRVGAIDRDAVQSQLAEALLRYVFRKAEDTLQIILHRRADFTEIALDRRAEHTEVPNDPSIRVPLQFLSLIHISTATSTTAMPVLSACCTRN